MMSKRRHVFKDRKHGFERGRNTIYHKVERIASTRLVLTTKMKDSNALIIFLQK